jgi:hypothetical protein
MNPDAADISGRHLLADELVAEGPDPIRLVSVCGPPRGYAAAGDRVGTGVFPARVTVGQ